MRGHGREGFILVAVLGVLVVLAGLVGAASYLVRTAATGAAGLRDDLVLDALTQAGLELAGYQLFMLNRPTADINAQQIRLNDGVVTLFVTSEAGKIDLNGAPPELLAGVWRASGGASMTPETFAARVADYRDADSEKTPKGGAEAADYAAAGPAARPADAPFAQVDELQHVLGVTPQEVRAIEPLLTVHNPDGKLSALDASPQALRALPELAAAAVDRIVSLRRRGGQELERQLKTALGDQEEFVSFEPGAAFSVRVEVRRGDRVRSVRAVLTRSRAAEALYFITDWDPRLPAETVRSRRSAG
jgi:general secretion pathway protein K